MSRAVNESKRKNCSVHSFQQMCRSFNWGFWRRCNSVEQHVDRFEFNWEQTILFNYIYVKWKWCSSYLKIVRVLWCDINYFNSYNMAMISIPYTCCLCASISVQDSCRLSMRILELWNSSLMRQSINVAFPRNAILENYPVTASSHK